MLQRELPTALVSISPATQGSRVEEEIYPLSAAEPDLPHGEVVAELMALEASAAEKRAAALLAKWGFPGAP